MSKNKKIIYGDNTQNGINGDRILPGTSPAPEGSFTFDRTDITFDSIIRTFDEI